MEPPDGRSVVERLLAGDRDVVAEVRRVARHVVTYGCYRVPAGERDDTIEEAVLSVYEAFSRDGFALTKGLACFVRKVAHRRCLDLWRQRRDTVEVPPTLADPRTGPDGVLLANERWIVATQVLEGLSPSCRALIEMHILKGLPYAVIAAMTGRSEVGLRVKMCECLKKALRLRDEKKSRGPEPRPRPGGRREARP